MDKIEHGLEVDLSHTAEDLKVCEEPLSLTADVAASNMTHFSFSIAGVFAFSQWRAGFLSLRSEELV